MNFPIIQRSFLSILLRTIVYLALVFGIIYSFLFAKDEYDIYTSVPPEIPVILPEVQKPLNDIQKKEVLDNLNYLDSKFDPVDVANKLKSIPKPQSTLTEEEKNKILEANN